MAVQPLGSGLLALMLAFGSLLSGRPFALSAQAAPPTPERCAEVFRETAAELEPGGDLYLHVNVENLLPEFVGMLVKVLDLTAKHESGTGEAAAVARRVEDFLRQEGFYDAVALGVSSRPRGDGTYSVRTFLSRRPAQPPARLWRMMGGEPRELAVLNAIPADAALLVSSDFRLSELWAMFQQGVRSIGGEEPFKEMRGDLEDLKKEEGIDVDALVGSHTGEIAIAVLLSKTQKVALPLGGGMEIPTPSLLLALGVRDDSLMNLLLKLLKDMPVETEDVAGVAVRMGPPMPDAPVPLRVCAAQAGGLLFFASNPDTMKAALAAMKTGNGLKADPEFRRMADRLPPQNNGVTYVSERFNRTLMSVQMAQLKAAGDGAPAAEIVQMIYDWMPMGTAIGARVVKPNGVYQQSEGPSGGREMVAALTVMPLAMVFGIATPAMVQARSRAQEAMEINTLHMTLRMVDAAKEQWAMEHNKDDGTDVTLADIMPYLRPEALKLPPGHQLNVNPVGTSPQIVKPDGEVVELP